MKFLKTAIASVLLMVLGSLNQLAFAGNVTANTQSSASITSFCTVSANNLNFGTIPFGVRVWVTTSMSVLCTKNTNYTININYGHVDATQPQDGDLVGSAHGDLIDYAITSTMNGSSKWSNVTGQGSGATQTINMYGVAITGLYGKPLYPTPDNYADTATIVLTY